MDVAPWITHLIFNIYTLDFNKLNWFSTFTRLFLGIFNIFDIFDIFDILGINSILPLIVFYIFNNFKIYGIFVSLACFAFLAFFAFLTFLTFCTFLTFWPFDNVMRYNESNESKGVKVLERGVNHQGSRNLESVECRILDNLPLVRQMKLGRGPAFRQKLAKCLSVTEN